MKKTIKDLQHEDQDNGNDIVFIFFLNEKSSSHIYICLYVETEYVTIATRIEDKVDKVMSDLQALSLLVKDKQGKSVNEEMTGQAKYKPACFFCLDESHKVSACSVRKFCIGCTSNLHPYDRCDFKDSTCDRCQMVGHDSKVH